MERQGEAWRDPAVVERFTRDRAAIVPHARAQVDVVRHVVAQRARPPARIVDLGCGDAYWLAVLLADHPAATGDALDFSEPMLARARDRLAPLGARACVHAADLRAPGWAAAVPPAVDVVVSGFAIHHLPDARKRALYGEIFDRLAPGGVFLNVEHVASTTADGERLFDDAMIAFQVASRRAAGEAVDEAAVRAAHLTRPDKADNVLRAVDDQCAWLRAIGFADVDCWWKWLELAIFGGVRPA